MIDLTSFLTTADLSVYVLAILFFVVAVVYSSVGFGGGSSYLALLAVWNMGFEDMRLISLLCNVVVVSTSVYLYYKKGLYNQSKIMSLVMFSVPLAFIGGMIKLDSIWFKVILGVVLWLVALLMWLPKKERSNTESSKKRHFKNSAIGGAIGFVSGLVGLGGGVFLSPYLNISRFDSSIRIAAYSSFFILVNSLAGIGGQWYRGIGDINYSNILILVVSVFIGGQVGVRLGMKRFSANQIKRITAVLIALVGLRILLGG